MDYSPLVMRPANGDSWVHYEIFGESHNPPTCYVDRYCHSNIRYLKSKDSYVLLYVKVNQLVYSFKDFQRWIAFVNTMGFKIAYIGEEVIKKLSVYSRLDQQCYILRVNNADFISVKHMLAAITVVRYAFLGRLGGMITIPKITFKLKSVYGRSLSNFKAVQLAYYCSETTDTEHCLIERYNTVYLSTLPSFLKGLKTNPDLPLSSILRGNKNSNIYNTQVKELYNAKNWEALAKLIKIKYKS